MNPPPSGPPILLTPDEAKLLSFVIAAPSQEVAADWLDCSPTHLRRLLKELRHRCGVETNAQLIVLASVSGCIDPGKVLPFGARPPCMCVDHRGEGATSATPVA